MKTDKIATLLPWIFQRSLNRADNPLNGYLEVMSKLHEPTEALIDNLHTYFNPYTAPEEFLPFLAQMLNLEGYLLPRPPYLPTGINALRNLLANAIDLSQERGTRDGMVEFLEIATGVDGFAIREGKKPFHLEIRVPSAALKYRTFVEQIIRNERPAFTTFELIEETVS